MKAMKPLRDAILRYFSGLAMLIILLPAATIQAQNRDPALNKIWEKSLPFLSHYTTDHYRADLQNWSIIQGSNGLIYVGNNSGVLEFDGATWRLIKTSRKNPVRSLAKDSHGRIYVGSIGELGYLGPDMHKGMRFHSLLEELDSSARDFGNVWQTFSLRDSVYFVCDNAILRWSNGSFRIWKSEDHGAPGFAWLVNNIMYVDVRGRGLMQFKGDSLVVVDGGEKAIGKGLMSVLPYKSELITFAHNRSVLIYDGKHFTPFKFKGTEIMMTDVVYHGIQLSNGDYALGTTGSGFYLMSSQGEIKLNLARKDGLTSDAVYYVFEDAEGDVWLATDNGISRIELNSRLRVLNDKSGVDENSYDIEYFNNRIFIANGKGLFQLKADNAENSFTRPAFTKVKGIDNLTQDCHIVGEDLMISNYDGIFLLKKNGNLSLIYDDYTTLIESPSIPGQKHLLFETSGNGISELIYSNGLWNLGKGKLQISGSAYGIVRAANGSIFINTKRNGLYEVRWPANAVSQHLDGLYTLIHFDTTKGLPSLNIRALEKIGNVIYASTDKGLYHYDPMTDRFKPATEKTAQLDRYEGSWVNELAPATMDTYWLSVYHNYKSHIFKKHHELTELPESGRFSNTLTTKILDTNTGIVMFGSDKGIVLYDDRKQSAYKNIFKTTIRKVSIGRDSLIYAGYSIGGYRAGSTMSYTDNGLHFQYALPSYDLCSENQYQYWLQGFDDEWSPWSTETQVNFTNLSEGSYTFRVRGRNIYGEVSEEDVYSFTILPPWYRTIAAFILYGLSLIVAVVLIVNWRSRGLKREKQILENTIKERTEKITQQAKKLMEMDRLKSNFFANISHEFRTPLTLILAPLEQEIKNKPPGEAAPLLIMRRNANRLLELTNQLLDLSRLEAGKMELRVRQQDIYSFFNVIGASFDSWAQHRQIKFIKEFDLERSSLWFDKDKLEKIVTNLLANAFKFTPVDGVVTLKVACVEKNARDILFISVKDTGKGIPKEEQQQVFLPFYQTKQGAGEEHGGTGLGLSLVKELVRLHRGEISLQSSVDSGTTISIELPADKHLFLREHIVEGDEQILLSHLLQRRPDDHSADSSTIEEPDITSGKKNSILVAEDNADLRNFITSVLKDEFEVLTARDGEEALELALRIVPDLVLTDLMMPEMDGMELTEKIKSDERTSHIPVVLLTARSELGSRLKGLRTGADDYLTKPFSTEELLVRVRNLIEQRKHLVEKFRERFIVPVTPSSEPSLDDKFLLRMREIVEVHMVDPLFSVEQMADKASLSRTQLLRKLKALTGLPPNEFIKDLRLQKAAEMIRQRVDTITQIGYAIGFNDQSYFTKCFKKRYGMTPTEFSQQNKEVTHHV